MFDDAIDDVANRLQLPRESETSVSSSFRVYPGEKAKVLGCRPFSLALYGEGGKVSQLSMVFANKGDEPESDMVNGKVGELIARDAACIEETLRGVLGEPVKSKFGSGHSATEKGLRWDWNGQTILLVAPKGEYAAVRVLPTSVADGEDAQRVPDSVLREQLAARVERRENGDVVLADIPMVDQGPKGYCVPATWERALRYLGIPADMYILAMAGSTSKGGGTYVKDMVAGASDVVRKNGRRLSFGSGRIDSLGVSRTIDKGLPILWSIYVDPELNREVTQRSKPRKDVTDWNAYAAGLKAARSNARRLAPDHANGHMCMIIGYNRKTREIAISDSWGPEFSERWITDEEAQAIHAGDTVIINW